MTNGVELARRAFARNKLASRLVAVRTESANGIEREALIPRFSAEFAWLDTEVQRYLAEANRV